MANTFDHNDTSSWYFGTMSRQEANNLLLAETRGVFLVRDSATSVGDYALCVRKEKKVSNYLINKLQQNGQIRYRIGNHIFTDLPNLLEFFKFFYLDTTLLIRPAPRKIERIIAKYDFKGREKGDLPFKNGEILTIISKDLEQWWIAKNSDGVKGYIPVSYVQKFEDGQPDIEKPSSGGPVSTSQPGKPEEAAKQPNPTQHNLPAMAKVKRVRVPNPYDKTALKLEVGDIILVTKTNINGQWEGQLNGKIGHFLFTHVEFLDTENECSSSSCKIY